MLVVEFATDSPILAAAVEASDARISLEAEDVTDPVRLLVWAEAPDLDAFEAALADDPTIADAVRLAEAADRRLYRVDLSEAGEAVAIYPVALELDAPLLTATAAPTGWHGRARFPDREAFAAFRERCRELGLSFSLEALYTPDEGPGGRRRYGVSERQRAALVAGVETGYFAVPRERSLAELAAELGVSSQAASERLRRGTATLVRNTLR